ncbi:DM13 domain-containing protein [Kordia sp.]|uniref:T9SS type A sorting domain-containing protein n=1 Tax=Kordia sp. TaxID=1965332 RepID=UPI003B59805C
MKTKLLLLVCALFGAQFINAQCTESLTAFGNNTVIPMYNIQGDVSVTLNTNNTVTLDLASNFMTAAGPDIRAYFVKSNGLSDAALASSLVADLDAIQFGLVGAIGSVNQNGAKSFTISIPTGDNVSEYDRVLFYCLQFNQFWDFGKITPFTAATCSLLSVGENSLKEAVAIYPNPTNDYFEITNDSQNELSINIYDILGNNVISAEASRVKKQSFSLANLNSGVYLVELKSDNQKLVKKLIKR